MSKDEAAKEAREREIREIVATMRVDITETASPVDVAKQHNKFVDWAVDWFIILRDSRHDFSDFRQAVEGALKIAIEGQDEMKKEHKLLREEVTELKVVGKTSLWWLKVLGTVIAFMISAGVLAGIVKLITG